MTGRGGEHLQPLQNLDVTRIDLGDATKPSLSKDIIEIITGVSGNAIAVGGKITAGTIIYTGNETENQHLASRIFSIGSLVFSALDFTLIPLGYLYKWYKKENIPFNADNNIKWALAGLTFLLAIISTAIAVTARIISFITAGVAIIVGIASVAKYFYDYRKTGKEFQMEVTKVSLLTSIIENDMQMINELQDKIRQLDENNPDERGRLNPMVVQLAECYRRHQRHCEELKTSYHVKHHLERKFIRQKSPVELVANSIKFLLAGIVLGGTILALNPVTAPIGTALLITAAVVSLVSIIAKKAVQIVQKRIEREHETRRDRYVEIPLTTTQMMKKFNSRPENIAKRQYHDHSSDEEESKPLLGVQINSNMEEVVEKLSEQTLTRRFR